MDIPEEKGVNINMTWRRGTGKLVSKGRTEILREIREKSSFRGENSKHQKGNRKLDKPDFLSFPSLHLREGHNMKKCIKSYINQERSNRISCAGGEKRRHAFD